MLPYSIVSSLDYYRKLYQPNKYVLKDNLQVSHTVRKRTSSDACRIKNLAIKERNSTYLGTGLPLY
jgi:hypothetical protein